MSPRSKLSLMLSIPLLGVGGFLLHDAQYPAKQPASEITYTLAAPQPGLQAHIDPVTGHFVRPSPEQARQAQPSQSLQKSSQVRQRRLPDGSLMLDLQQRYRPSEGSSR